MAPQPDLLICDKEISIMLCSTRAMDDPSVIFILKHRTGVARKKLEVEAQGAKVGRQSYLGPG
jgi:hypothetical protein